MALKRNILIVDDETTILNFLKDGLSMYQDRLNVYVAGGVEDALKIVDNLRIDLITTDIRMPEMDGFELISRSRKKNPDTRFIVMTGYSCEEYFHKSKNFGVIDYIRKPFDFEEFVERVFQALEASRGFWAARLDGFQITDALQLVHMVRRLGTNHSDAKEVGRQWGSRLHRAMHRCMEVRQLHEERFLDVRYETLLAEPMAQIHRIYQFVGMELSPAVEHRMQQWAAENAREKRATHHYTLDEFGFSEQGIRRDFAAYYRRFLQ